MHPGGLLLAVPLLIAACALIDEDQDVQVLLPPAPAHWQVAFPRLGFILTARDSSGRQTRFEASGRQTSASIRCARSLNEPILAWPYAPGLEPGLLRPAGGFFPLSLRQRDGEEAVELTWENGAAALVTDRALAAGRDVSRFNVGKLCRYLLEAGDPWALDLDKVAQKVADGEITVWDIDALPAREVLVSPGPGAWFIESPFRLPCAAETLTLRLQGVPLGTHLLCSLEGQKWKLEVGEEETVLIR